MAPCCASESASATLFNSTRTSNGCPRWASVGAITFSTAISPRADSARRHVDADAARGHRLGLFSALPRFSLPSLMITTRFAESAGKAACAASAPRPDSYILDRATTPQASRAAYSLRLRDTRSPPGGQTRSRRPVARLGVAVASDFGVDIFGHGPALRLGNAQRLVEQIKDRQARIGPNELGLGESQGQEHDDRGPKREHDSLSPAAQRRQAAGINSHISGGLPTTADKTDYRPRPPSLRHMSQNANRISGRKPAPTIGFPAFNVPDARWFRSQAFRKRPRSGKSWSPNAISSAWRNLRPATPSRRR